MITLNMTLKEPMIDFSLCRALWSLKREVQTRIISGDPKHTQKSHLDLAGHVSSLIGNQIRRLKLLNSNDQLFCSKMQVLTAQSYRCCSVNKPLNRCKIKS